MRQAVVRRYLMVLMVVAIATAAGLLFLTETGRAILNDPHQYGGAVQRWVAEHRLVAPLVFVTIYITFGVLALPVWWMQILGGYGFGLVMGLVWCQLGAAVAAVGTASMSRFLLGEWFHTRVEAQLTRLRKLDEQLGRNGLLVVCVLRMSHFVPAGPANLALGLSDIRLRDVALGTLLGGIPTAGTFVTIGAARHLLRDWRFITGLIVLNVVLIGLVSLPYLKSAWRRWITGLPAIASEAPIPRSEDAQAPPP